MKLKIFIASLASFTITAIIMAGFAEDAAWGGESQQDIERELKQKKGTT
ncbi:MAG TPA: hypothetical protein VG965_03610 [Patescibacteria group bacterium]|nr:hypothetical protein [Patescibacteria group bacterium]